MLDPMMGAVACRRTKARVNLRRLSYTSISARVSGELKACLVIASRNFGIALDRIPEGLSTFTLAIWGVQPGGAAIDHPIDEHFYHGHFVMTSSFAEQVNPMIDQLIAVARLVPERHVQTHG